MRIEHSAFDVAGTRSEGGASGREWKGIFMPDVDLGVATDWDEGDTHGRIRLEPSGSAAPDTSKKDVVISSPLSIELSVNTNRSESQEYDKIFFTTYVGGQKKIIGVLDSEGNLRIAGSLTEGQNLSY